MEYDTTVIIEQHSESHQQCWVNEASCKSAFRFHLDKEYEW